ncbi:uncharacterized protein LOC111328337 [Stylophora pistillata]|uniref:uncharacterized protein LOC111328337 n=1 Tax=Stylophora pistillata TaxID=50429 RepID=UPI000C03D70D|nr:uncharacterized protein LOC111328337 [Stylophora pistillata]
MYQNFSCTEACVCKMKTTALCIFAVLLSSLLVEGMVPNKPCPGSGCKERTLKKFRDKGRAENLEMLRKNIRRRLEEAQRERQYRRGICLQARELGCKVDQMK